MIEREDYSRLPITDPIELIVNHCLVCQKQIDDYPICIALLESDEYKRNRTYYDILVWKDDVSNNVIIKEFSPGAMARTTDEKLNDAISMVFSMADEGREGRGNKITGESEDIEFHKIYMALGNIGISDFDIEQISYYDQSGFE